MRRSAVGGAAWTMGYGGTSGGGSAAGEPLESGTYQRAGAVPGEGEGDGSMEGEGDGEGHGEGSIEGSGEGSGEGEGDGAAGVEVGAGVAE